MFTQLISERFFAFRHSLRENWTVFDCETEETAEISGILTETAIRHSFANAAIPGGAA